MPNMRRSSALKWERGNDHFSWLEEQFKALQARTDQAVHTVRLGDEVHFRLARTLDPPGEQWSLVIGDCVQNYRAALDHCVYELAPPAMRVPTPRVRLGRSSTGATRRPEDLQFPIHSTQETYGKDAPRRISTLPSAAQKIIELAQPFKAGAQWTNVPLAELQELSDIDKHRRLHVGQPVTRGTIIDVNIDGIRHRLAKRQDAVDVRLRPGLLLATVSATEIERYGPIESVKVDVGVRVTIAFDDSGIVSGRGVIGVLRGIGGSVEHLLDELDPFVAI